MSVRFYVDKLDKLNHCFFTLNYRDDRDPSMVITGFMNENYTCYIINNSSACLCLSQSETFEVYKYYYSDPCGQSQYYKHEILNRYTYQDLIEVNSCFNDEINGYNTQHFKKLYDLLDTDPLYDVYHGINRSVPIEILDVLPVRKHVIMYIMIQIKEEIGRSDRDATKREEISRSERDAATKREEISRSERDEISCCLM